MAEKELTNEQRVSKLYDMMHKQPTSPEITKALLDACVNAISDDNGRYTLFTPFSESIFNVGLEIYTNCIAQSAMCNDTEQKRRWLTVTKNCLLFLSHKFFDSFMLYLEFDRKPEQRFYAPRKRQLKPIVDGFQEVADGKLDLLTVSQPVRTGKTTLGLLYIIWRAGFFPEKSCLLCGRGDNLVKSFYQGMLEILQDKDTYNYWDVFPGCILTATNAEEKTIDFNNKKRFSTIVCRSIDGKLTGATEASNLLYIDDLVTNWQEAQNITRLEGLWDETRGTLIPRRKEGTPIIAQGTRFSLYDPIGKLQEIAPQMGWRTKVVEVPALDPKTDTSNFNYRHGIGFSTAFYRHERNLVSEVQWNAQYQQVPIEASGAVFPRNGLQYYTELPDLSWDCILACCDTSEGKGDFTAMLIGYVYGQEVYIEDLVFSTALPEFTAPACGQKCVKNHVGILQVESNANGLVYAEHIQKTIEQLNGRTTIRTKRTTSNKATKIIVASDNIRNKFWFKDPRTLQESSEYMAFLRNMWAYNQNGKNQHDDAADVSAMLENMIASISGSKVEVFKRPF